MAVALALARAGFRRRGLIGLAVVLAVGVGAAMASLEAARRTEEAYPAYLRRAEVADLVVNPSLSSERAEEVIVSTPGVVASTSSSFLGATPDDGHPRPQLEVDNNLTQVHVSSDGRYLDQDRPVVHEGRMIRDGAESFVSVETADALGLKVGDVLPLAFWATSFVIPGIPEPTGLREPLGRVQTTVVGIGVFADEVLVDELYPRRRIVVTPEVGAPFDCSLEHFSVDDPRSLVELALASLPPGCALNYRYHSLRVVGGDAGAREVADRLVARLAELNETLPLALREDDSGYLVIPTFTADDRRGLAQSLEPAVRALQLFGVAAAGTTLVVFLLGALRIARRDESDAAVWLHLGATRSQRMAAIALPLAAAAAAGLMGALVVSWLGSGAGPLASARAVESAGRLGIASVVVLWTLALAAMVLAAGLLATVWAATRRRSPDAAPTSASWPARALSRIGRPSLTIGVRSAVFGPGARALLAAAVAAVVAVVATAVFTTSLTAFASDPERYGWPYDAAVIVGFGYGGSDEEAIKATLDRPEVRAWGMAGTSVDSTIDGEPVPFIAGLEGFHDLPLPVIRGVLPEADDEIALGTLTADRLGLAVGDKATLTTPYGDRQATVSGLVVLPAVGPFEANRTSLGTGALLSHRFVDALLGDAERAAGMEPGALREGTASLVVIDLADGVDKEAFLAGISDELATWDLNGFRPFVYTEPVRPGPVADVAAMQAVPIALVAVFALAMIVGLALGISAATRARRRELAVLRALGCVGRQLRASVRWHAACVAGIGLVVGLPVGIALGRIAYRSFADGLGFFPEPVVSPVWTAAILVGTVGLALLASAPPAWVAARTSAAAVLRNE